jgi:hypothetical protein
MCAFADKVTGFFRSESDLGIFAFLYILRFEIQLVYLDTVSDIGAVHHQHDGLASLESDQIRLVGKSFRGDFNSPGRLGTARVCGCEQRHSSKEHYWFDSNQLFSPE